VDRAQAPSANVKLPIFTQISYALDSRVPPVSPQCFATASTRNGCVALRRNAGLVEPAIQTRGTATCAKWARRAAIFRHGPGRQAAGGSEQSYLLRLVVLRFKRKELRPRGNSLGVKLILFSLFCAVGLWADESQDRAAIDEVIAALNDPVQRVRLLTQDVDSGVDFDRLVDLHRNMMRYCQEDSLSLGVLVGRNEPWTELTVPRVVSGRIRFITPTVAIVDGASTIRGAVILAPSVPLLFVMKKDGAVWRINAVRVLTDHATMRPQPRSGVTR
jgi:hypothetical protein